MATEVSRTSCSSYHVFFVLIGVFSIWPKFMKIKYAEKNGGLREDLSVGPPRPIHLPAKLLAYPDRKVNAKV
jgi:hypothetical protein